MTHEIQHRELRLDATTSETAPASLSSETPVLRPWGWEILDHSPDAVDLSRADAGVPILWNHNASQPVGMLDQIRIVGRRLRGRMKFFSTKFAQDARRMVEEGLRTVSVGYSIGDMKRTGERDGEPLYTVTRWTLLEASIAPVAADVSVGVGRSLNTKGPSTMEYETNPGAGGADLEDNATMTRAARRRAAREAAERESELQRLERAESRRVQAIELFGEKHRAWGGDLAAAAAIASGASFDQFREQILDLLEQRQTKMVGFVPTGGGAPGHDLAAYGSGARNVVYAGKLTAFTGPTAERDAYASGQWLRAAITNDPRARQWVADNMGTRAMGEGIFSAGGATVPLEMSNAILQTVDQFSVFRRNARVMQMNAATMSVAKATGAITPYFVGENQEAVETAESWTSISLTPKKLAILLRISNELQEDNVVGLADYLARESARVFGEREDRCAFIGDATSTYGGMRGLKTAFESASFAGGRSTTASGHDTLPELDATDLANLMGALPARALPRAKFYCSPVFFGSVFQRLMLSAGGLTIQDLASKPVPAFMGYPIEIVPGDILPNSTSTDYTSVAMALFGDLSISSLLGLRRDVSVRILNERYSEFDQTALIVTERFDIVHHDIGNATSAGACVALFGNS